MKFKRIYIEINNTCNFNCSFCIHTTRTKKYMNLDEFKHVINEIKPYTNYVYLHLMGEPLIHPHLNEFISICKENGINVNITTNASLLKEKLDILLNNEVRQINISLHSIEKVDESFYNYIDSVFDAIKRLNESTKTYINLRLWDINTLSNIYNNRHEYIIDKINSLYDNVLNEVNTNSLKNYRTITIKENIFMSIESRFNWPTLKSNYFNETGTCRGLKDMCAILVDGKVTACCLDSNGDINLGNIFETSFSDIINSDKVKDIINGFNSNKCVEQLCKKCEYKNRFK